ncbi:MAG: hypothetical protein O2892_07815 [Actinomycetota bacterium]|nr:hypothetical protein [Actinomycetota bacterium]MDA2948935.1 hypothetical protein [Actinomycetota bacterium]
MAENLSNDALRSQVRMQVAFWKAQDRRSITTGPAWLWRGPLVGPRRTTDLDPPTARKIVARRAAGMPAAAVYGTAGPRRRRLPRAVSPVRAAVWILGAGLAAAMAVHSSSGHPRAAAVFSGLAAACALVGSAAAALEIWARRDPLNLNAAEASEIAARRREIIWNPLAGAGAISAAGAYMLEALDTCTQLREHPAWQLPGTEPLRWQIDLDEEIFQIARAAAALDQCETSTPNADGLSGQSYRQLTAALLERLVALHRCLHTLSELSRTAAAPPGECDQVIHETLSAAVENELATGEWNELNADLLAHVTGYAVLAEVKTSPR